MLTIRGIEKFVLESDAGDMEMLENDLNNWIKIQREGIPVRPHGYVPDDFWKLTSSMAVLDGSIRCKDGVIVGTIKSHEYLTERGPVKTSYGSLELIRGDMTGVFVDGSKALVNPKERKIEFTVSYDSVELKRIVFAYPRSVDVPMAKKEIAIDAVPKVL